MILLQVIFLQKAKFYHFMLCILQQVSGLNQSLASNIFVEIFKNKIKAFLFG